MPAARTKKHTPQHCACLFLQCTAPPSFVPLSTQCTAYLWTQLLNARNELTNGTFRGLDGNTVASTRHRTLAHGPVCLLSRRRPPGIDWAGQAPPFVCLRVQEMMKLEPECTHCKKEWGKIDPREMKSARR